MSPYKKLHRHFIAIASLALFAQVAHAQLPNPTYGWNLGNCIEPPSGEGTWGPAANQATINAVKANGFNTIRIPCAWNSHANQSTLQIDSTWMARVKQVVDWCYAANLYVVLNCHWDNGWFDSSGFASFDSGVNNRVRSFWTQIATTFKNYDSHLLFACANEPAIDTNYGAARTAVLVSYYQTFVNAVRATGSNNASRWLVIQGPNANISNTNDFLNTLPTDSAPGRLMVEVHDYDPYQYTLMTSDQSWGSMFYFWGSGYHSTSLASRNSTWGEESWLQSQFLLMYNKFTSKGIPVSLGEFGAVKRTGYSGLTGNELTRHLASRTFFDRSYVQYANLYGIRPCYWDAGGTGSNTMWLFDRNNGSALDADSIRALTGGAALTPPGGESSQYNFETSTQSWTAGGAPITGVAQSTTQKYGGSSSLKVSFNGAAATSQVTVGQPPIAAGKTVTFHVWIPSGSKISSIQPFVQDKNWAWTGTWKAISSLQTNAWNTVTVVVPSNAAIPLQQIGVQFTTSASWSGSCYVDSISW